MTHVDIAVQSRLKAADRITAVGTEQALGGRSDVHEIDILIPR